MIKEKSPENMVLIVDDDPTTLVLLRSLLHGAGMNTVQAEDISQAEEVLQSRTISLVLLDVNLPDGSGLDFCRTLHGNSSVPVLFLSGNTDLQTKLAGFDAGGVDYITKPLIGAEVLARVRTHLKLRAAYDELSALHAERIQSLGEMQSGMMPLPADHPDARFQVGLRQINQAGGDVYDVIPQGDGITDYVVADVCGHDISASLWTASFTSLLSEFACVGSKPLDICLMLNKALRRILPENAYFTVLYARINRSDQTLSLVNAGHPPAVLVDMQERNVVSIEKDGDLLGMFDDAVFGVHEQSIKTGDRLYLFTDGLIEQTGKRDEGVRKFLDVCRRSLDESLDDSVFLGMASVCVKDEVDDDLLLMGIEV